MDSTAPQLSKPTTIEGIGIHLGYVNEHLASLDKKMDSVVNNTVSRDEWSVHLRKDEDHEARIRVLEKLVERIVTEVRIWGVALGGIFALVELALRYYGK